MWQKVPGTNAWSNWWLALDIGLIWKPCIILVINGFPFCTFICVQWWYVLAMKTLDNCLAKMSRKNPSIQILLAVLKNSRQNLFCYLIVVLFLITSIVFVDWVTDWMCYAFELWFFSLTASQSIAWNVSHLPLSTTPGWECCLPEDRTWLTFQVTQSILV